MKIKSKRYKKCVIKRKLKSEDNKNCLQASQHEDQIIYLNNERIVFIENREESIKRNKKLKSRQRFQNQRHGVFTEEINKISLGSNDDKRMQSIDSIQTCAYGKKASNMYERKN